MKILHRRFLNKLCFFCHASVWFAYHSKMRLPAALTSLHFRVSEIRVLSSKSSPMNCHPESRCIHRFWSFDQNPIGRSIVTGRCCHDVDPRRYRPGYLQNFSWTGSINYSIAWPIHFTKPSSILSMEATKGHSRTMWVMGDSMSAAADPFDNGFLLDAKGWMIAKLWTVAALRAIELRHSVLTSYRVW
jgi:hypothetical protein